MFYLWRLSRSGRSFQYFSTKHRQPHSQLSPQRDVPITHYHLLSTLASQHLLPAKWRKVSGIILLGSGQPLLRLLFLCASFILEQRKEGTKRQRECHTGSNLPKTKMLQSIILDKIMLLNESLNDLGGHWLRKLIHSFKMNDTEIWPNVLLKAVPVNISSPLPLSLPLLPL